MSSTSNPKIMPQGLEFGTLYITGSAQTLKSWGLDGPTPNLRSSLIGQALLSMGGYPEIFDTVLDGFDVQTRVDPAAKELQVSALSYDVLRLESHVVQQIGISNVKGFDNFIHDLLGDTVYHQLLDSFLRQWGQPSIKLDLSDEMMDSMPSLPTKEEVADCCQQRVMNFGADDSAAPFMAFHSTTSPEVEARRELQREDAETDRELAELAEQRQHDMANLQMMIAQFISKYHQDPTDALKQALGGTYAAKPRDLIVNKDMRFILPGEDEKEVRPISALSKSLYILFLLHPEGIVLKQMGSYRAELDDIYSIVKPGASDKVRQEAIKNVTDPCGESLNQNISRIKAAFKNQIWDPDVAQNYYIKGKPGQPYKIALDRDRVSLPRVFTHGI